MEKGKGKLAIAIVAMFVVALSIVGFTYAYFVSQVEGNESTNVTVTAGKLEISYKNTRDISVTGIAPGWKSDGLHYFLASTGCTSANKTVEKDVIGEDGQPTGEKTTETIVEQRCTAQKATAADQIPAGATGVTDVAQFTVSTDSEVYTDNENTDKVNYVVLLNGIKNDLGDKENFTYVLCKGTCDKTANYEDITVGDSVLSKGVVGQVEEDDTLKDVTVQVISGVEGLDDEASQAYELMLYYANITGPQDSKGKSVTAQLDVIGVQKDAAGNWVDGNGVIVIPA